MFLFTSRQRSGLSILESLIVLVVCIILLLITVPVALVRAGIWKPAKPVEIERPKDLMPKDLRSGDSEVRVPVPEAPRLPPDAKLPERLRSEIPSGAPTLPTVKEATKASGPSAAGPQLPAAQPPAISPILPGETSKK